MLRVLTHPRAARYLFPAVIFLSYALLPMVLLWTGVEHAYFGELAGICLLGSVAMVVGAFCPLPLHRLPKVAVRPEMFTIGVWSAFLCFVLVADVTAERIPLLASIAGADAETIAILRERFLKAREGWQSSFVYINALFAGFLIPYSLAQLFLWRSKLRWICFSVFLIYTLSFAEKAFFFKAVIPLFYLIAQKRIKSPIKSSTIIGAVVSLIVLITVVSRVGTANDSSSGQYFSAQYVAAGPLDYMVWRTFAIPVVTAADGIGVFHDQLGGVHLRGATSSVLARMFGKEPVYFERLVFAAQWGQNETGTGSANSVYAVEAFVNFGYPGVVVFSLLIGVILRLFALTRDEAFQSLWILFCLNVYFAGLIGTLLSNGFILLLFLAMFVKFRATAKEHPASLVRRRHATIAG